MANRMRARVVFAVVLVGIACGDGPTAPSRTEAIFQVRACRGSLHSPDGEVFRILLRDSALIAEARALIGVGNRKIVAGNLAPRDGGFNAPWSWHLAPDTVRFPEVTVELCDGCPSLLEAGGRRVGAFCPWSSEVIAEQN